MVTISLSLMLCTLLSGMRLAKAEEEKNTDEQELSLVTSEAAKRQLEEESRFYEDEELKQQTIHKLLQAGRKLAENKQYDRAVEVLERIFILDPVNLEASREIDRVKSQFIEETLESYKEAERLIDEEMSDEISIYIESSKKLIERKRFADAKVLLHKVLLLNPNQKEAKRLLDTCQKSER